MNITAIISEYNPLHKGHLYHIETARKETNADFIIAIMSGNFVQRGTPAIIDKYTRAEAALKSGVDLVLELPTMYATASAEYFALGGVSLANTLGCVTHLSFGSEYGQADKFMDAARLLLEEPEEMKLPLQEALKEGNLLFDLIDKYQIKSMGFNILLTDSVYSVPEQYFIDVSQFIVDAFKIFRDKGIYEDRIMRKVNAFVEHKLHFQDCAAEGGNQLVVAPDGEVGLCHGYLSTRETFVTNVNDIDFDMTTDPVFLDWNKRTPFNMPQCENCMALGTCGGGCALNAKANGKSIWDLDERFCVHAKATIEFLIWDLFEQIKTETMN